MKRPLIIIGSILLVLMAFIVACSPAPTKDFMIAEPTTPTTPAPPTIIVQQESRGGFARAPAPTPTPTPTPTPATAPSPVTAQQIDTERKIVRTANIAVVVDDVPAAIQQITTMAESFTGFVVSSNVLGDRNRLFGSISVRIPAERFDTAMGAIRTLAIEVSSETTNAQDVTEEFVDLTAKLKNLEATEQQLLIILQKAVDVQDVLAVQRELSNVRSEIERTKGRLQFLERTSSTSLINVSLQQSKLDIDFAASSSVVKDREQIRFSVSVSGGFSPYSYNWDLGDGTTSTEANPLHSYKKAGAYTVKLTVTDDRGNEATKTRTDYITVLPGWSAGNIVSSAWDGLVGFGRGFANVIIWLVVFIPVWLVVAVIAYAIYRVVRWRKKSP